MKGKGFFSGLVHARRVGLSHERIEERVRQMNREKQNKK